MVTCKLCEAQFPGEGTQGHGCASTVYQKDGVWYLLGHYGSRLFDMNRYKFVAPQHPDDEKACRVPTEMTDPVCDICVSVWQNLERLVLVEEHVL